MTRFAPARWMAALHATCGIVLCALISLNTGCSMFQTAVNRAPHWQENRADCPPFPDGCGNNDCVKPCVALEPTEGYLRQGPTFGGEQILGSPSPSAIERMLELTREVESLRSENNDLRQQLGVAEETIRQQGISIDAASQELQRALADFSRLQEHLTKWEDDARQLQERLRTREGDREQLLSRFEADLQDILAQCETRAGTGRAATNDESTTEPTQLPAASPRGSTMMPSESLDDPPVPPAMEEGFTDQATPDNGREVTDDDEELPLPRLDQRPVLQSPVFSSLDQMSGIRRDEERSQGGTVMWLTDGDARNNSTKPLAPIVKHMDEHAVSLVAPRNREAKHDSTDQR